MKKLLLVLAIAAFVACNDSGDTTEAGGDTTSTATQPTTPAPTPDSTTATPDSTKPADSLKK